MVEGARLYRLVDFLTESLLFQPALIDEGFASVEDMTLDAELQRYREYCFARREELVVEAVGSRAGFRVFSGLDGVPLRQLKQTALNVDGCVLSDPLFPFTERETEQARVMRTSWGTATPMRSTVPSLRGRCGNLGSWRLWWRRTT